jgi:hypothetical protein
MSKLTLTDLAAGYADVATINSNSDRVEVALENTLSRDGSTPNTMGASLDMNSNRIINVAAPVGANDVVRLQDLQGAAVVTDFPSQVGNAGKFLTTDGTVVSWDNPVVTDVPTELGHLVALGQCELVYTSTVLITLRPRNGNKLTINGEHCTVPDAGVTLAPTGLVAGTRYFIYATKSAGVVNALVASTVGHSASTTANNKGVEIETGDDSRTLVGMIRIVAGPLFNDSITARYVRSWFHDKGVHAHAAPPTATYAIASAPWVLIAGAGTIDFLVWASERVTVHAQATYSDSAACQGYCGWGIDSVASPNGLYGLCSVTGTVPYNMAVSVGSTNSLSEGYHNVILIGGIGGGSSPLVLGAGYSGIALHTSGSGN